MDKLKRTPLYDRHVAAGGKIVPFAGYELPVQYPTGIKKEHGAVRTACGLFDVSHMGEIFIRGEKALDAINYLLSNRFDSMTDGRCRYTVICNEEGGIKDDLLVYRLDADQYLLVVNAANRDKDREWLLAHLPAGCELVDESDQWGQLALQGPQAETILKKLTGDQVLPEKFYTFVENIDVAGVPCLISRTGYTAEDGFELYMPAEGAVAVWDALLSAGESEGLIPCGLGARDTLRLEGAMPLYGHELREDIDPFTADLGFAVKMDKEDFIGKAALTALGEPKRKRVGLEMTGRGIAREGAEVLLGDEVVGEVTSGTHLPHLNAAFAMALVPVHLSEVGTELAVRIRDKGVPCVVTKMPFYSRS